MVEEEEYQKEEKSMKIMSVEVLFPLLIIFFVLIFHGRLGILDFDIAQFVFFGGTAGVFFIQVTWDEFKHRTRKVVTPFGFSTFTGDFFINPHTNNAVIKLGGVRALTLEMQETSDGVLIAPIDKIQKTGNCAVLNVDEVKDVRLEEIPDLMVMGYLLKEGIGPPYYIIKDDHYKELKKPNINKLIEILDNKKKENASLEDDIDKKWGISEKSVSAGARIKETAGEETIKLLIQEMERKKREEEAL